MWYDISNHKLHHLGVFFSIQTFCLSKNHTSQVTRWKTSQTKQQAPGEI